MRPRPCPSSPYHRHCEASHRSPAQGTFRQRTLITSARHGFLTDPGPGKRCQRCPRQRSRHLRMQHVHRDGGQCLSLGGVCAGLQGRDLWDLFLKEDLGSPLFVGCYSTNSHCFRALFLCEFVKKHFRKKNQHVCQVWMWTCGLVPCRHVTGCPRSDALTVA